MKSAAEIILLNSTFQENKDMTWYTCFLTGPTVLMEVYKEHSCLATKNEIICLLGNIFNTNLPLAKE